MALPNLDPAVNFAKCTVSTGYDASATSIVLDAGDSARFPDPASVGAYNATWWNWTTYRDPSDDPKREIVRVTAKVGSTLTVTRGQESISAQTKNDAGCVYKMAVALTKKQLDDIETALTNIENDWIKYPAALKIGDPTDISNMQDNWDHMYSAGVMHDCVLTSNGNGTATTTSGSAMLRAIADAHSPLIAVAVNTQATITLTDKARNYVYLDYNGGTPIFASSTSSSDFNCQDKCIAYIVYREGTALKIIDLREQNVDFGTKNRRLQFNLGVFRKGETGTAIGSPSGLTISVTAGQFNCMTIALPHDAFDTSVAGTNYKNVFTLWYRDGTTGYTSVADTKVISTTVKDTNTGTPTAIGNSRYVNTWFYVCHGSPTLLHAVMGRAEFSTASNAYAEAPYTALPPIISAIGSLIGFVTYQKNDATFNRVATAFGTTFSASAAVAHDSLSGLNGGDYQHLTAAEATIAKTQTVQILLNDSTALTTAAKAYFRIPSPLNAANLVAVAAMCKVASSSGIPTFTIKKGATSMLSTNLTIDANEYDSSTAVTPAVIDTAQDDVTTGTQIEVACTVAGTGTTYAVVELQFRLP